MSISTPDKPTLERAQSMSPMLRRMPSGPVGDSAMNKLREACARFSRERDGVLLTAFEGTEMDKEDFRAQLRLCLNCKLTPEEMDLLMPLFDHNNNGKCDGAEFILVFYRLRNEYRSKLLTDRIAAEKRIRQEKQLREQQRQEEYEQKVKVVVKYEYTDEEMTSAIAKITDAAVRYDRLMPGTVQLNAFDGAYMNPKVFKEQLKHVFNIKLSPGELGALMHYFDKDGDGFINCAEFLIVFFRRGFEERAKAIRAEREERKRVAEEKKQRTIQEKAVLEHKNSMKVNYEYTEEDKRTAFQKLRAAARLYDKSNPTAPNMNAFEGAFMEPHVFKEQLRRVFNLKLSPYELGALMHAFDDDGDGTINCAEFTKHFQAMGFKERERELKEYREKQQRALEKMREEARKKEEEQAAKNASKVDYDFSEEEFQSALAKLTDAAWKYDRNMPGNVGLDAFQGQTMEPHVFKEQLKRVLNLQVSPKELGALMSYFDKNGDGMISCPEFLIQFVKLGFEERSRRKAEWKKHEDELQHAKRREFERKQTMAEEKNMLKVQYEYTEDDYNSAMAKLTRAATFYDRNTAGSVGLDAFEGEKMAPHVFKEQLKRVFNIRLSPPELGVLMAFFDKNGDGFVNCQEFLIQFFRTGFEERSRIRREWRELKAAKEARDRKREEDRIIENETRAMAEVDFNFSEEDFDVALKKLIDMCFRFDRRQVGPAWLKAFDASTMTPSEFREMLKRTFNLKLTAVELGALVTYHDPDMLSVVNCTAFLNSFTQIRVKTEEFKGKPGEAEKLKEYHGVLKENYKRRILKKLEMDDESKIRPWRVGSVFSQGPIAKKGKPTTPAQKVKRRLAIAKKTGRLDLSTRIKRILQETQSHNTDSNVFLTATAEGSSPVTNKPRDEFQIAVHEAKLAAQQRLIEEAENTVEYKLESIPNSAFDIRGLTELWLCYNPIKVINPRIVNFSASLKCLSIAGLGLATYPTELLSLVNLTRLYAQRNNFSQLPDAFADYKELRDLNLSYNNFDELPNVLLLFNTLIYLNIGNNRISLFPESCANFQSLSLLNLENTSITELSPAVQHTLRRVNIIGLKDKTTDLKNILSATNYGVSLAEEAEMRQFLKHKAAVSKAKKEKQQKQKEAVMSTTK